MAKNTHAQEIATGTSDSYTEDEVLDPTPPLQVTRPELGTVDRPVTPKEEPSPAMEDGGDFTRSSKSESPESTKPNQSHQQPAPTTENLSSPTPTADSGVASTDGVGLKTEQPQSGRKTPATTAKKTTGNKSSRARATVVDDSDDFDDFS